MPDKNNDDQKPAATPEWTTRKLILFSIWWPLVWTILGVLIGHAVVVSLIPQDARHWTAIALCTVVPSAMLSFPLGMLIKSCPQVRKQIIVVSATLTVAVAFAGSGVLFTGMQKIR
jgi:hypothetical protein